MEAKASAPTYGQMTLRTHPAPMSRSTSSPPTAEPTTLRSRSPRRGGVREGSVARPGADLVLAQDALDGPGEIGGQQLVGDPAAGREPLALAGPDHRPVERARLRHEAADGGVERGGDGLEGGDGGIELVALELAERAHAHPHLLGHPAQGQAARQPPRAEALSEAGRARHGRTLSSSTEKVKGD